MKQHDSPASRLIDMAGRRFSGVTGVRRVGTCGSRDALWEFRCDCGNLFEANGYYVRAGKVISCPDCARKRVSLSSRKHGLTNSPEYSVWTDIKSRCHNKNSTSYPRYGGRGISVCQRWRDSFETFLGDMGKRPSSDHSIDRIDNNRDYCPSNCRWATRGEQANNKRNNIYITINGDTRSMSQWAREYGVLTATASLRYKQGLRGEAVFRTRVKQITFGGITDTISGWSRRTGIKQTTIAQRINSYNWPVDRALTQGAK